MARTNAAQVATEDLIVPPPAPSAEMTAAAEAMAKAPVPSSIMDALQKAGERNKAAQSRTRKQNGTATTKPETAPRIPLRKPGETTAAYKARTKGKAAKAPAKAKAERLTVERVPAAEVVALIELLGITRTQLGKATGKSPSLITEWTGHGRGHLVARSEWKGIEVAARKFAKGIK